MKIRPYESSDWTRLCEIHDPARIDELTAFGQPEAFLSLQDAAENEGLFEGEIYVAEIDGVVEGFVGFKSDEVTWLYVSPARYRQGIGRALLRHAIAACGPETRIELLEGNERAMTLYLSEGFIIHERAEGRLAGNERFAATGFRLVHRKPVTIVLDPADREDMIDSASSRKLTTMATIQQDIESFHQFASEFVRRGESKVTIDDLYEQWRTDRFGDDDLKAVKASLNDLDAGEKGLSLDEFKKDFDRRRQQPTSA